MRSKSLLPMLLLALVLMIPVVPVRSTPTNGPRMTYLHITNYVNPDAEFAALEAELIDIIDWPLTAYWINKWVSEGKVPSQITLCPYGEVGSFEYDIDCQRWPTGCDGVASREGYSGTYTSPTGRVFNNYHTRQRPETSVGEHPPAYPGYDPYDATKPLQWGDGADKDPETESWKTYFDADCIWCVSAWGLRLALAFLTDKDYITSTILEGYADRMIAWAPEPQRGFLDVQNLTTSSFVYRGPEGDVTISSLIFGTGMTRAEMTAKAVELLDAAGFKDWNSDGIRNDPRKVAGADKKYGTGDDVKTAASNMGSLIFYIRLDDPNREAAGLKLAADMEALAQKIPVDERDLDKTVCFKSVMVEYKYHLYTGGYSFGVDPWEMQYSTFHSSQFWAPVGWSGGYQGWCHELADQYMDDIKNSPDYNKIIWGMHNATFLENKYVSNIPLWSSASAQAYRTGWNGVVNVAGYGPTWGTGGIRYWSLSNMEKSGEDTINLGFKSSPEDLSVVSSEWVWDWVALDATYETLIARNPYNLAKDTGILALNWSKGTWGGDKIYVDFTLKPNVKWHDGTLLTAEDVEWGIEFIRDCGPGVAWNYPMVSEVDDVVVLTGGSGGKVRVKFATGSYWAVHLVGYLEFPSKKIWTAADAAHGWGYNPTTHQFADVMKVRDYKPYDEDVYNKNTGGAGSDGIKDLAQDGTGPWKFVGYVGSMGEVETIDFEAWRDHHMSQDEVSTYLNTAFHEVGNVNYPGSYWQATYISRGIGIDRKVDEADMILIEKALWTTPASTHGIDWHQWNEDANLYVDTQINALDLSIAGRSYGKTAG